MLKGIRYKLFAMFLAVIAAFLICSLAFTSFIMPRYYNLQRESVLRNCFTVVAGNVAKFEKNLSASGNIQEIKNEFDGDMQTVESRNGVRVIIANKHQMVLYGNQTTALTLFDGKSEVTLPGLPEGTKISNLNPSMPTQINIRKDASSGLEYISFFGSIIAMKDTYYVFIDTTVEASTGAIEIMDRFLIYSGIFIAVIGGAATFFMTRRFVDPILRINEAAGRIAKLDFSSRVNVAGNDELAVLGTSVNMLSDQLEGTITSLQTANKQLKLDIALRDKTDEMRKEFISNVSHELKTPISLISGYAEGLKVGINEEDRDFYCEVITDEARNMGKLVNRLLYVSQIDSDAMRPEMSHFDICALIDGCLENHSLQFKEQGITVERSFAYSGDICADIDQIRQVITNYVSNATNHIAGEKKLVVRTALNENHMRVEVENTGEPIPEESIPHVWESFYKVDKARTREYGGTGLGLYIVSRIVENHGGTYGVYNTQAGVCFWFELEI